MTFLSHHWLCSVNQVKHLSSLTVALSSQNLIFYYRVDKSRRIQIYSAWYDASLELKIWSDPQTTTSVSKRSILISHVPIFLYLHLFSCIRGTSWLTPLTPSSSSTKMELSSSLIRLKEIARLSIINSHFICSLGNLSLNIHIRVQSHFHHGIARQGECMDIHLGKFL